MAAPATADRQADTGYTGLPRTFRELADRVVWQLRLAARQSIGAVRDPQCWTPRWTAFGVLAVLYVVLALLIIVPGTFVTHFDTTLVELHLWHKHPGWYPYIAFVVGFGQRWVMTGVLQLVIVWAALRSRSIRPLVLLATTILILNVTVGALKYLLGRVGPIHGAGSHTVFHLGADIFPSGHVSNAVALYGVLAWAIPRYRRQLIRFAVFISFCVGMGTIYMKTHWFSDVVGGWIIGGLVLLAVPSVLPVADRFADQLVQWLRDLLAERPEQQAKARQLLASAKRLVPADPIAVDDQARGLASDRARGRAARLARARAGERETIAA